MPVILHINWTWFCFALALFLILGLIKERLSRNFFTNDVIIRRFNQMDIELSSSALELYNLFNGIHALPKSYFHKTIRALRWHIRVDFLYMLSAHAAIFIACMRIGQKVFPPGDMVLFWLAWLQLLAWFLDVLANIYLLNQLKGAPSKSSRAVHRAFSWTTFIKWSITLLGTVCVLFATLYFWATGKFSLDSMPFLLLILAEFVLIALVRLFLNRAGKHAAGS